MSARPALSRPSCIPSPHVFQRFELQLSFGWCLCCFVLRTSLCGCHCSCRQRFFSVSRGLRLRIVPSCPAWLFMSISICLYVHMCTTCILFLCISNTQMCFTCNIPHVDFFLWNALSSSPVTRAHCWMMVHCCRPSLLEPLPLSLPNSVLGWCLN